MRIIFIGSVEFSRRCLLEVLRQGGNVVAVLNPSKKQAEGNNDYADLAPIAKEHGIPLHRIGQIDAKTVDLIHGLKPDIIFVFGFSQLISKAILDIPPLGCIGTHPAPLPVGRGRHPLIWALVNGLSESGLTFFYLDEKADSGDILWQVPFPITKQDDAGTLYEKMCRLAEWGIAEFLPGLKARTWGRRAQDHSKATYTRKRTEADGLIDWTQPAEQIHNLIRALTHPYCGAHTYADGLKKIIVWKSFIVSPDTQSPVEKPGCIIRINEAGALVQCGEGLIGLTQYQGNVKWGMVLGDAK